MRFLHRALRLFSDVLMLPLFELFGGTRDTMLGGRLCVLHTVGRKSGLPRQIPLSYAPTTAGIVVLAGFGRSTGWAHNLRARPEVSVLVGSRLHEATAVEITDLNLALAATRALLRDAGAAGFFYGWDPRRASDDQVRRVVDETICFHLRFVEPPTRG
jgi:deazaflavin-dependent oxidoreductase (nitroreductase family)